MSDVQSVAPTAKPLTIAQVKQHLNVSHNEDDELLQDYIDAATLMLEKRTNRCFVWQTRQLKMRTFADPRYVHGRRIYPPRSPLASVTSISYVASDGTTTTLQSSDYVVSASERPGRISEAYNATWPATRVVDNDVTVTYVAGHSSSSTGVPANVKLAIRQAVAHWYRNRESHVDATMSELPFGVVDLLESEAIENYG